MNLCYISWAGWQSGTQLCGHSHGKPTVAVVPPPPRVPTGSGRHPRGCGANPTRKTLSTRKHCTPAPAPSSSRACLGKLAEERPGFATSSWSKEFRASGFLRLATSTQHHGISISRIIKLVRTRPGASLQILAIVLSKANTLRLSTPA